MSHWSEKEIKFLTKLVKKRKSAKYIAKKFDKKGFNKNVFVILSKIRSTPELRPYFEERDWIMEDIGKLAELLKKRKKPFVA